MAAQAIIEQARVQGGRRVTGHWEKVRAGQAGRLIVEEAQRDARAGDRHAAAARARAARCSARRSRPCSPSGPCRVIIESGRRPSAATAVGRYARRPCQTPRDVHRDGDADPVGAHGRDRRRARRAHVSPAAAGSLAGISSACCSCSPGAGGCGSRGAALDGVAAQPPGAAAAACRRDARLADAVRRSSTRRWPARSTSRSASSPTTRSGSRRSSSWSRGAVLRADRDDLRRGRLAAPGPRRLDGLRPLRVQRAVELRRGLGDPARLRDPASRSPRSRRRTTSRAFWAPLGRRRARARRSRSAFIVSSRSRNIARLLGAAPRASRMLVAARPRAAAADRRPRAGRCSSTRRRSSTRSTSARTPTLGGPDLRADGSPTVAFTGLESASGLAGEVARQPRAGSSAWSRRHVGDRRRLRRHRARGGHRAAGRRRPDARSAATGTRRADASASPARSTRTGSRGAAVPRRRRWRRSTLVGAANSAMLGLSRLAYSLATNRQIPSALGRLHPTRSTPYVLIVIAAVLAGGARRSRGPRLPGRHLRVRRAARVHDRARLDRAAALPRARPRPALPRCRCRSASRGGDAAAAGGARRARLGAGWVSAS